MNQEFNDTHNRLVAVEKGYTRLESAIAGASENLQKLTAAIERMAIYQQQHDAAREKSDKRIEELNSQIHECSAKFHRWLHIGVGVWFVAGSLLAFGGKYVFEGIIELNKELHEIDKRILRFEQKTNGFLSGAKLLSCPGDDNEPPPQPIPAPPDTTITRGS